MTRTAYWVNAVIAGVGISAFVVLSAVFGHKWLTTDEPNRSYPCGSGSRGGTCFSGEINNMVLTLVFAGLAIGGILLCLKYGRPSRLLRPQPPRWTAPSIVVLPQGSMSVADRLQLLETLHAAGAITDAEYRQRREQVIAGI